MASEEFLRNISLFQNLDSAQLTLVSDLLKEDNYEAGQHIVEEGNIGGSLFIISEGKVKVCREFEGKEFVLTELGPYDFFGEMSLIDDFPTSATVETIAKTSLLKIDRNDFKALVSSNTDLSARLWEALARNLTMKIRKTGDLVRAYYGLNKALCENEQFRQLYTSWNYYPYNS